MSLSKVVFLCIVGLCSGFVSQQPSAEPHTQVVLLAETKKGNGFFGAIGNFFEELDAFVDDASSRRLGNGAAFYGKRRSNFYGKNDKNKKADRNEFDPLEDYYGPSSTGYFKWMPDEQGQFHPVTRMKDQIIEKRNMFFGDNQGDDK